MSIVVDMHPPEEYGLNSTACWQAKYNAGKTARDYVYCQAKNSRQEAVTYALVHYHIICDCERERDDDNWLARCKPMTDALVKAGLIKKDSHKYCKLSISFEIDKARAPRTIITVTAAGGPFA